MLRSARLQTEILNPQQQLITVRVESYRGERGTFYTTLFTTIIMECLFVLDFCSLLLLLYCTFYARTSLRKLLCLLTFDASLDGKRSCFNVCNAFKC